MTELGVFSINFDTFEPVDLIILCLFDRKKTFKVPFYRRFSCQNLDLLCVLIIKMEEINGEIAGSMNRTE